jgi:uncharacterized protein
MKNAVFVDTVAWIALVNKSEELHESSCLVRDMLVQQKTKLVTSDYVIVEIANFLSRIALRGIARELIDFIRSSETINVVTITPELAEKAYQLYCSRNDKEWGLTDCISFIVMNKMHMIRAFTADRHFEQAGFSILLK